MAQLDPTPRLQRKSLPHDVPLWVDPSTSVYYVTVCCAERGRNHLARPEIGPALLGTVKHRNEQAVWFSYVFMIMPDHVHALMAFPQSTSPMRKRVSQWKGWTAKQLGIQWQRDFFEHRLRSDEQWREKAAYILANPVRKGLVKETQDWPYVFIGTPW